MVNATPNTTQQQFVPQTSSVSVTPDIAKPETTQPRSAPAADSQKSDQGTLQSSRQDNTSQVERSDSPQTTGTEVRASSGDRGQVIDLTV